MFNEELMVKRQLKDHIILLFVLKNYFSVEPLFIGAKSRLLI